MQALVSLEQGRHPAQQYVAAYCKRVDKAKVLPDDFEELGMEEKPHRKEAGAF
jgi:hypothetical protein